MKKKNKPMFENGAMVHIRNTDRYGFISRRDFLFCGATVVLSPTGGCFGGYKESDLESCSLQEIIAYVVAELRKEIKEEKKQDKAVEAPESLKWFERWERSLGI